ncbi:MAG: glycosyltransferase [Planctomycetota bacterium]
MRRVLWIVQDGVLGGPGASQSVPYLDGLARRGFGMHLLSFERRANLEAPGRAAAVRRRLGRAGVSWTALPYGEGPGGVRTLSQVLRAVATGRGIVFRERIDLVHARSYLPGLMALGLGRPFLFDMRGMWPMERVDGGVWREGSAVHRAALALERTLLDRSVGVVALAHGAREHLPDLDKPFRVIPTAVDLERFRPGLPPPPGAEHLVDREVWVVAGALGTWYLLDAMLDLVAAALARNERGHALLLTEEDATEALAGLVSRGVARERITVRGVPYEEVPHWFSLAAAGILLIKSAPSKRASAPTKLGEFLASGVPVVTTPRIGDSGELVRETGTGVVTGDLSPAGLSRALSEIDDLRRDRPALVARCRRAAEERLSLPDAISAWADLYEELIPCD